jgi:hypothetical protein
MTRMGRQLLFTFTAVFSAALLAMFLGREDLGRDEKRPDDMSRLGRWMSEHPADWHAAAAIAENALDSGRPDRVALWRAAYVHARQLAPGRTGASEAFIRGGLLHWHELGSEDRRTVLEETAPLLHDPATFGAMYRPLWELTHDFGYLRRNAPQSEKALTGLSDLAVANGLFDQYRELRSTIRAARLQRLAEHGSRLAPQELLALLPQKLTRADDPLVRGVLGALQRRPLDPSNAGAARRRAPELVRFVVAHGLGPLEGIDALTAIPSIPAPTRALLAIASGRAEEASNIELAASFAATEDWSPYYLERSAFEARRGNEALAARYRQRAAAGRKSGNWIGTCGPAEVCTSSTRTVSSPTPGHAIDLTVSNAESDEVPPYVEVFVDDALVAEAAVSDTQVFHLTAAEAGDLRVEVRLANPRTRNRLQRRVRLS